MHKHMMSHEHFKVRLKLYAAGFPLSQKVSVVVDSDEVTCKDIKSKVLKFIQTILLQPATNVLQ